MLNENLQQSSSSNDTRIHLSDTVPMEPEKITKLDNHGVTIVESIPIEEQKKPKESSVRDTEKKIPPTFFATNNIQKPDWSGMKAKPKDGNYFWNKIFSSRFNLLGLMMGISLVLFGITFTSFCYSPSIIMFVLLPLEIVLVFASFRCLVLLRNDGNNSQVNQY